MLFCYKLTKISLVKALCCAPRLIRLVVDVWDVELSYPKFDDEELQFSK